MSPTAFIILEGQYVIFTTRCKPHRSRPMADYTLKVNVDGTVAVWSERLQQFTEHGHEMSKATRARYRRLAMEKMK